MFGSSNINDPGDIDAAFTEFTRRAKGKAEPTLAEQKAREALSFDVSKERENLDARMQVLHNNLNLHDNYNVRFAITPKIREIAVSEGILSPANAELIDVEVLEQGSVPVARELEDELPKPKMEFEKNRRFYNLYRSGYTISMDLASAHALTHPYKSSFSDEAQQELRYCLRSIQRSLESRSKLFFSPTQVASVFKIGRNKYFIPEQVKAILDLSEAQLKPFLKGNPLRNYLAALRTLPYSSNREQAVEHAARTRRSAIDFLGAERVKFLEEFMNIDGARVELDDQNPLVLADRNRIEALYYYQRNFSRKEIKQSHESILRERLLSEGIPTIIHKDGLTFEVNIHCDSSDIRVSEDERYNIDASRTVDNQYSIDIIFNRNYLNYLLGDPSLKLDDFSDFGNIANEIKLAMIEPINAEKARILRKTK